jgi:hypothetical protein
MRSKFAEVLETAVDMAKSVNVIHGGPDEPTRGQKMIESA